MKYYCSPFTLDIETLAVFSIIMGMVMVMVTVYFNTRNWTHYCHSFIHPFASETKLWGYHLARGRLELSIELSIELSNEISIEISIELSVHLSNDLSLN